MILRITFWAESNNPRTIKFAASEKHKVLWLSGEVWTHDIASEGKGEVVKGLFVLERWKHKRVCSPSLCLVILEWRMALLWTERTTGGGSLWLCFWAYDGRERANSNRLFNFSLLFCLWGSKPAPSAQMSLFRSLLNLLVKFVKITPFSNCFFKGEI